MTPLLKRIAKIPLAPVIAAMFGSITLTLILMTPGWLLERVVNAAGLPAFIPAAQPPLGNTARILCAVAGALAVFSLFWALLWPLQTLIRKRRPQKAKGSRIGVAPAMSPTNAMKRPPIFAGSELGAPFMSDEAIAATVETIAAPDRHDDQRDIAPASSVTPTSAAVTERHGPDPDEATVSLLADEMARLEAALARRNALGVLTRPRPATDPVQLRTVLRHMG